MHIKNWVPLCLVVLACQTLFAVEVIKENNTLPLNEGASWVAGVAPTAADVAVWSNNLAGANSSALTNAATWDGVKVINPGGPVTVFGSTTLTLDDGAATDINLTSATQNLTFECAVKMTGESPQTDVAAGRVLTFSGPLLLENSANWAKKGLGTVVMNGSVTSSVNTTLELQKGTTVLTGESGGMTFTGGGSRIYVGRYPGGDGTLIVSNGVHVTGSTSDAATANFVGVTAWGHLFLEGGSLTLRYLREAINSGNGEIVVNGGTLNVWGGSETAVRSGYALMIGNQHEDNGTAVNGSGALTVNGGEALFTNGIIKVASDSSGSTGTQVVNLNGGLLALKRFYVGASVNVTKTVNLNGGLLRVTGSGELFDGPGGTNGTLTVNVGDGGLTLEVIADKVVTVTPPLIGAGSGGLTKTGHGRLAVAGANTYTGKTRVMAGVLCLQGAAVTAADELTVISSAGLSLADGALATFAPTSLTLGHASAASTLELEVAASGSACDVLAVPAGATLGRVAFAPVDQGTLTRAKRPGDYVVLTYAGAAPDTGLFTVSDPAAYRTYSFVLDAEAKTVTLHIAYSAGAESEWSATGGGAWETASNWTVAPANAAGTKVLLGGTIAAPATVTAAAPVTLGGMTIDSSLAYTLAGGGYLFDNGASDPYLSAVNGSHTVSAALTLGGAVSVAPALGATLTLAGAIDGGGSLVLGGAGELLLTSANSYSGGTVLKAGSLLVAEAATVGTGPITTDGAGGIRFNYGAPVTIANDVVIAQTANFNCLSNDVALTGNINWEGSYRSLVKTGDYELSVSGSGAETALSKFQVENGILRFVDGANFELLSIAERDGINMKAANGYARTVIIEAGAHLTVSGIDTDSGLSNTVIVAGGSLTLLGGGGSVDAAALRENGTGIDRVIVDSGTLACADGSWFGVGYRGGEARLIVNGGTATLSRVSMGARELSFTDMTARGFIDVNGGLLEVRDVFNWMGSAAVGRTNMVTLGNGTPGSGVLRTCATENSQFAYANTPIMVFNGGTLELTGLATYGSALSDYLHGAKEVFVAEGGARIDTLGLDVVITQPLQAGAVSDGGLTKLGAGTLTLTGACGFTGPTAVSEGALTVPASYASTGLALAAGTTLNLVNGGIQTLALSDATLASGGKLAFEALADGSACDRIDLPSGATVGDLTVSVVRLDTGATVTRPGDYVLFTCAGTPPTVSGWTLLNPPEGRTAEFVVDGSSVVLRVAYPSGVAIWTTDGSGDWETAGNWNTPPGDAAGAAVRLDDAITASATVTLAGTATLGYLAFNNAQPYTVGGAALTLSNTNGLPAVVAVESGSHVMVSAMNASGELTVQGSAGASVAAIGGVTASGTLAVEGPGALGVADASALSVADLAFSGHGTLAVSNSTDITLDVVLGAGGGAFAPATGETVDLQGSVSGVGGLTQAGSGFLLVTNANGSFAGAATANAGTLRLDALPAGGLGFGQGTVHYIGGGATVAGGYALDTGDATRAGVLRADADITFQGSVSALSGALVKTGPGTVTFTAPGENVFNVGNGAGASHSVLNIGPFGDSPTVGFSGFNVAEGKVVLGAAGQTNVFHGLVVVGLNSTTNEDAETAGQLEVVGGVTTMDSELIIGRSNGNTNTAPVARASTLRMTGGELTAGALILGRALDGNAHNAAPELELTGGLLTVTDSCFIPEQKGAVATVTISGGKLDYLAASGNSLRCCEFGGDSTITLSGDGELSSTKALILCYGAESTSALNLDGGMLTAQNISKGSGTSCAVTFNGGSFRPTGEGQTLQGLTSAKVGTGGAIIDLSQTDSYTLAQKLTTDGADGGLTKTGAGTLVVTGVQAYDGPTVVSEGALQLDGSGSLSNVTALTVSPGATLLLDPDATRTVALGGLTLGSAASTPASLTLTFAVDGTSHDVLAASGPASIGAVAVTLRHLVSGDAFGLSGTYTLVTYTGADPNVSEMTVANPLYGKTYTFAAASGALTLTIGADYTGASTVWSATGGGAWETADNWALAPGAGAAGMIVRFDDAIATPATVTVSSGVTAGSLLFNNANAYTLSGASAVSLDNGSGTQAVVSVEYGTHTLALPVALSEDGLAVDVANASDLTLDGAVSGDGDMVKTGPGTMTVAQASTRAGKTEVREGALVLKDGGTPGTGEVAVDGGEGLRVSGTGATLSNTLTLKSNAELDAQDASLTLTGTLDMQATASTLTKVGTNQLVLAGTGRCAASAPALNVRAGGVTLASGADYSFDGPTRESVRLGAGAGVKTTLTIEDGAVLTAGGLSAKADTSSTAGCDTLIVQNGGEVNLTYTDALFVRHDGTAPATYVMNGGTLTMPQTSWANVGLYGPGYVEVNGGLMSVGRFAAGYETRTNASGYGSAHVTVNGGRLEATGSWSWMSDSSARLTEVTLNGGTLALPATRLYTNSLSSWIGLTFNGGLLETTGAALDTSATDDYLAGLRRVAVGVNGGAINTLGNDVTIRQNVLALSSTGGVAKVGAGTLTLAGTNVIWGLADAQEGVLRARLTHRDLPGTPLVWLPMDNAVTNQDVSGNGFPVNTLGSGTTLTNRTATSPALALSGSGAFSIPYNTFFTNVGSFTASAWIRITANVTDSNQSIISARTGSSRAFELKLNSGDNRLRLLEHSYATQAWWQDIRTSASVPLNQWVHVAAVVTPDGCAMYLNGVPQSLGVSVSGAAPASYGGNWVEWLYAGDVRLIPAGSGAGIITVGRTTTTTGASFKGLMDEVMLFERTLSDEEVAQLASEAPVAPASARAATGGVLDFMGEPATVSEVTGGGTILGDMTVLSRLSAGDTAAEAPGAVLTVGNLTLGTNMTVACSCDGVVSDIADVTGELTVAGSGVIDFGRTEANPFTTSFSVAIMNYGTVSGAPNFANWTVTGLGRNGFASTVEAVDGEVVVTLRATWGTLMLMR
jgi:autotransporter-associated beta strand protein